jgi:MFS family permease
MLAGAIGAASNVGFLLIASIARWIPVTAGSWRWIMLVGAAPALLTFFIRLFVPESERWKSSQQGGSVSPPVGEIFSPSLRRTTILAICFGAIALIGTWGSVQWIPTWVEKQLTPEWTKEQQAFAKAEAAMASSFGAIIGCFVGALLGGGIGRRPVYFGLCLGSLAICTFMFNSFTSYEQSGFLLTVFGVGLLTAAFYGWLPLYLPELFPTRIRATGQGLAFNFGRILAAGGVLGTGALVNAFGGNYARAGAAISAVYALGLVLIWLAPETKGKPLPE